jgi:hypothetical protein
MGEEKSLRVITLVVENSWHRKFILHAARHFAVAPTRNLLAYMLNTAFYDVCSVQISPQSYQRIQD